MGHPIADPGDRVHLDVRGVLSTASVAAVTALCQAAAEADGVYPLSEHVSLHLRYGGEGPDRNLLLSTADGTLAGYAHLDPTDAVAGPAAEIVVHPAYRRRGYGRRLVQAAEAEAEAGDGRLRLWAHGDHPAARALAVSLGYEEIRQLWQMRRSLYSPLPAVQLPPGITLRAFLPGRDDEAWLALNARAFHHHPEQGGWTLEDLHERMRESWFDPAGFLLAEDAESGPDGRHPLVAFHWTKVHGGESSTSGHGHDPIGEVYVVGVDPARTGHGLGRAVTVAGLQRMRSQGLTQAMLYVEADNAPALAVYRGLGFTRWDTDVMFRRPQRR